MLVFTYKGIDPIRLAELSQIFKGEMKIVGVTLIPGNNDRLCLNVSSSEQNIYGNKKSRSMPLLIERAARVICYA